MRDQYTVFLKAREKKGPVTYTYRINFEVLEGTGMSSEQERVLKKILNLGGGITKLEKKRSLRYETDILWEE